MGRHEELMLAVSRSDVAGVTKLLAKHLGPKSKLMSSCKKLSINQLDSNGLALLHQAAISGCAAVTKALLEHGAAVDVADNEGSRPLHYAVEGGHEDVVRCLLDGGCDVTATACDGTTPLHVACELSQLHIIELLLSRGADAMVCNIAHKTSFDIACEFGHDVVVSRLLADPSGMCQQYIVTGARDPVTGLHTTSCLHLAARNGHMNVVQLLLDAGCDVNQRTREGSCLHEAIVSGCIELVSLLLDRGVDLSCTNSHKQTALDVICRMPASRTNVEIRHLLQKTASQGSSAAAARYRLLHSGDDVTAGCHITCHAHSNHCQVDGVDIQRCDPSNHLVGPSPRHILPCPYMPMSSPYHRASRDYVANNVSVVPQRRHHESMVSPYSRFAGHPPGLHVVGPIRSTTDVNQDCGSIVLHASFDSAAGPTSAVYAGEPTHVLAGVHREVVVTEPRSHSPVDQITELETVGQARSNSGTDSPGSTSGTSSSSSGYAASLGHGYAGVPPPCAPAGWTARQQHRLSGHSCESGVASCTSSSRLSYLSTASGSSHGSINRLAGDDDSAYASIVNFAELYENGYTESEIVHTWLSELRMDDCWQLFDNAGYDMPTISRMTPEDLTAIGITQPVIRKRLTAEISKLRINDGIPNYIPGSVMEWLQQLQLVQYYDCLTADGCYRDIDHVTDITWEDLEDIGITKLGHQKKMMLAIDRLKRLKLAAKRNAQPIDSVCPPPHGVDELSAFSCDGRVQQPMNVVQQSPASWQHTQPMPRSFGAFCAPPSVYCRPVDVLGRPVSQSPAGCHPEFVAVHVKKSANTSSQSIYDVPVTAAAVYESFHNGAGPSSVPGHIVSPYSNVDVTHLRRSSGDPAYASPQSRLSNVCVPHSMTRSSAPSTPLHASLSHASFGALPKKIPPAPPRRTNSIKGDGALLNVESDRDNLNNRTRASLATGGSLDRGMKTRRCADTANDNHPLTARTEMTAVDEVLPMVDAGSTGDCSTLPFANENVGTMRLRSSSQSTPSRASCDDSTDDCNENFYDEYSGTVRRRVVGKKVDNESKSKIPSDAVKSQTQCSRLKSCDNAPATSATTATASNTEFTDIDNLFDGLTHELNELLTSAIDA